jgi:hypothetical protein
MLQSPAHIIACTRAREKVDFSDPKNPLKLGIQPIQEKNFSYEATVSLLMHDQGIRQDVLKCPSELQAVLGRSDGYIGAKDGLALRQWVDGGAAVDPAIEHHRGLLLNATERGLKALGNAWASAPVSVQKALGEAFKEQLKASAKAYDEQRKIGHGEVPESVQALNARDVSTTLDHADDNVQKGNATMGVF